MQMKFLPRFRVEKFNESKEKDSKAIFKCASCVKHGKHLINLCNDLKKIESDSNG